MNESMKKIPLLTSEDIEVKVKQITKTGALALLYKTARTDRKILNEVYGPLNWTSDYKVVKDNLYCGIGIRESADQEFVWKWDCGIESRGDDEGNEKKGEASDAFKRAGFQVGIGEELYTTPQIWLDVATVADGSKYRLQDPYAKYVITHIGYNEETRVITSLKIANAKTNIEVFSWTLSTKGAIGKKMNKTNAVKPSENAEITPENAPESILKENECNLSGNVENAAETKIEAKQTLAELQQAIGKIAISIKKSTGSLDSYTKVVEEVTGNAAFKCKEATDADYDKLEAIYNKLVNNGN